VNGPASTTFSNVANALRLNDGSIVIADMDSRQIRFFNPAGHYIRAIGRAGSGPGEFESLWHLWRDRNRLLASDGTGRIHAFRTQGRYLNTTGPVLSPSGIRIRPHGFLGNGTGIGSFIEPVAEVPVGESEAAGTLVKIVGDRVVPIARFLSHVTVRRPAQRPAGLVYGPAAVIAVLRERVCVGYPRTYEFRCFDDRGALRTITRRQDWPRRKVIDLHKDVYFAGIDRANPGERGAHTGVECGRRACSPRSSRRSAVS